jgi:hypothetical protein
MKEYRIVKVTDGNNKVRYEVEWKSKDTGWFSKDVWYTAIENERIGDTGWHINVKQQFDSDEAAAEYVRSKELKKEVVKLGEIEDGTL